MKLLPESMFGRTLLIVAVLLVSVGGMAVPLADFFLNEARARRLADLELNRARLVATAYHLVPAPERERFERDLLSSQGIGIAAQPTASIPPPARGLVGALAMEIQKRIGNDQSVRLGGLQGGLWINPGIATGGPWIFLPRPPPVETLIWPWFASAAIAIILAILGTAAIVWRINRPLRELTDAAQRLAQGESPPTLVVQGPREVKTLSTVFNRMNAELARMDDERKLLLAGVSHDVRTPLTRLRLALDALPDPVGRAIKRGAIADVEDIDAILDHFLSFARSADDQTRVQGNLDELVATVCDRYERSGKAVQCELGGLPLVYFYPLGLRRLLMNLIDNALKHGGGHAHVRTRQESDRAVIEVLDRGPGIPDADIPRMLQPFQRMDGARSASGAGLGLAIAERMARQHGGMVRLHNQASGGLVVSVELPLQ